MNRFRFKMRNESMKNSCIIFCPEFFFQLAEGIKDFFGDFGFAHEIFFCTGSRQIQRDFTENLNNVCVLLFMFQRYF